MNNLNSLIIEGTVTDVCYTEDLKLVKTCGFKLKSMRDDKELKIPCVCFGKMAEVASKKDGATVRIVGRLDSFESDYLNEPKLNVRVVCEHLEFKGD